MMRTLPREAVVHEPGPWLPASGLKAADAPFERYDVTFDPSTGNGGLEIWIPIKE